MLSRTVDLMPVGIVVKSTFGRCFEPVSVDTPQLSARIGVDEDFAADGIARIELPDIDARGQLDQFIPVLRPVGIDIPTPVFGFHELEPRRKFDTLVTHAAGVDDHRRSAGRPVGGQEPIVLPLDITDCTKADTEIKDIHQKYGAVDILVNAAAMFMDGSLSEPVDNFRKIMEINVIAQYGILKTVTEIMKVQKNGYIFNVASRAAKYGFADGGIYGSTKFALLGLAESLYRELAPLGIRVTTLCPGWVNTDMAKKAGTPFKDEEMIQPDDLLNTIRCLLNLSENVCIKDIVFEMKKSII